MARGQVHGEAGGVDEDTAEGEDLRAGVAAAVPAGVRRRGGGGGAPVEPARAGRGQCEGAVPESAPGAGEPPPLERQGKAVAAARLAAALPAGLAVGAVRPAAPPVAVL